MVLAELENMSQHTELKTMGVYTARSTGSAYIANESLRQNKLT